MTETVDERRARLIPVRTTGSRTWRRVILAFLAVLTIGAGVFFGVVPGSSAVGRYPTWDLYALADRIEADPPRTSCGPIEVDAHVDLLAGRVVVAGFFPLDLSDEELAMVTRTPFGAAPAPAVQVTRIAIGSPNLCVMAPAREPTRRHPRR